MRFKSTGIACAMAVMVVTATAQTASADTSSKIVEESVREYFAEDPVMIEIARCESKFRQFNADGSPLYGGWGGGMIGVFQFYERLHKETAAAMGFDLATLEGNLGYAKHVYATSGTAPWNSAKACWENAVPVPATQTAVSSAKNLKQMHAQIAALVKIVAELQELLEAKKIATR